jgi:hypothetical protein
MTNDTTLHLRLWLVGDDEVLDVLAQLSQHLDYFAVSRVDELPDELGPDDHVVLSFVDEKQAPLLLARLLSTAKPGYATLVPSDPGDSVGARAILVAADLVSAIHDHRC